MFGSSLSTTRTHVMSFGHILLVTVFVGVSALSAKPLPSPPPFSVQCQTPETCFNHALKLKEKGNDDVSLRSFENIRSQFPGTIWAYRSRIHLGLLQKETAPEEASIHFREVSEEFPNLQDYINFWMAESLRNAHQPHEAAKLFEAVGATKSQSKLKHDALYLTGRAWRESGDCQSAIRWYRRAIKLDRGSSHAASALLDIGKCQLELSRVKSARKSLREVWWRFPSKPEAMVAEDLLRHSPFPKSEEPSLDEQLNRALSLYKVGAFEEAVEGLKAYLQHVSRGAKHDKAEYKLSMALVRLKRYGEAEKVFRRISSSSSSRRGESIVWLARSYLRQGKGTQLLAMQKSVRSKGLSGNQQSLIHLFAGVWLGDQGNLDKSLESFQQAYRVARSARKKQDALWRMTWIYYEQDEHQQVLSTLGKLLQTAKAGEVHDRARYWQARMYEHLKDTKKAQSVYADLAQEKPLSYYGQLASARLREPVSKIKVGMPHVPRPRTFSPSVGNANLLKDIHYRKAIDLMRLGLVVEAADELRALTKRSKAKVENLDQILTMAQETGALDFGIRLSIRHAGEKLKQDRVPRSAHVWNGAYPTGYISTIQQFAPPGLDPYLVAGLIREESLYDRRATSRVGALGLMQLMPATASRVARRLGLASPGKEELFDAKTNIRLGTNYVGQLLSKFNGNLVHTIAAYNAGPHVVRRWIAQDPQADPDEFVERISYRETRGYVKRVLGSYRIYRALASQSCQAVSLDRMC